MEFRREKDLSIETLRGAAIILVVTGHAIGDGPGYGMGLSGDSFLRHFYFTFLYLRMPLFTVISGWVYALRPAYRSTWKVFTKRKARRLLLPMILVGAIYYVVQYFVPGTNLKNELQDMWRLFIFPFTIYWYLPSLFIVFVVISLIDSFGKLDSVRNWLVLLAIAVILLVAKTYVVKETDPNYFSYKGAIYLIPFFIVGIGINRFKSFCSNRYLLIALAGCLVVGLVIQQLSWYHVIDYNLKKGTGIGLMIGLSGAVLLLNLKWKVKWLIWIGNFAFTIYLFHAFGTAGARIILRSIGINSVAVIFTISLLMGIALPIALDYLLRQYKITRLMLLGRAYNANTGNSRLNPVL